MKLCTGELEVFSVDLGSLYFLSDLWKLANSHRKNNQQCLSWMTAASSPSLGRIFVKNHRNTAQNIRRENFWRHRSEAWGTHSISMLSFFMFQIQIKKFISFPVCYQFPAPQTLFCKCPLWMMSLFMKNIKVLLARHCPAGSSACLTGPAHTAKYHRHKKTERNSFLPSDLGMKNEMPCLVLVSPQRVGMGWKRKERSSVSYSWVVSASASLSGSPKSGPSRVFWSFGVYFHTESNYFSITEENRKPGHIWATKQWHFFEPWALTAVSKPLLHHPDS